MSVLKEFMIILPLPSLKNLTGHKRQRLICEMNARAHLHKQLRSGCYFMLLSLLCSFMVQDIFYRNVSENKTSLMDWWQLLQKNLFQYDGALPLFTVNQEDLSAGAGNHSNYCFGIVVSDVAIIVCLQHRHCLVMFWLLYFFWRGKVKLKDKLWIISLVMLNMCTEEDFSGKTNSCAWV